MNVYLGLEKPQRVRILGGGPDGQVRETKGSVYEQPEKGVDGSCHSKEGSKEGERGNRGNKGSKGRIMYIICLACVYNGMIAAVNDTSCIYICIIIIIGKNVVDNLNSV